MQRQARRNRRPSRYQAQRRVTVAIGCTLGLGGAATFALSLLAVIASPDSLAVPAMGSLAMIGAFVALGGLLCLTSSEA